MDRARTRSMANTMSVSTSELAESFEELKNKYETLWEQVDSLYRDGATAKHVEAMMEKCVEQLNGRIVMSNSTTVARVDSMEKYVAQMSNRIDTLNTKTNDRVEVISNRMNDIVENDIGTLIKHERSNYTNIRGIHAMLEDHNSEKDDWATYQINLLQNDNKRIKAHITWLCYTNGVMLIILLYNFYN
jgi:hypothetical protein